MEELTMGYRDTVEEFLNVMTGKIFVKNAIYDQTQKTLFINFYDSFKEYKKLNPSTPFIESTYNEYFDTGNKIEKLVILESARLLRDFKQIETVSLIIRFGGKTYDANVNRNKLNDLIGFNIDSLSPNDSSWTTNFSDVYGYGINNEKRRILFNQFVNIK
jgi:hypothetical protein